MTAPPLALPNRRPGTLVTARGRDWLVLPTSTPTRVLAKPLGGADDETTTLLPVLETVSDATFALPSSADRGDVTRARLLREALRLSFRHTTGPFRSFANLSVQPRNYQLVPLLMSTAQDTTRLLIADGVGIGKTIEAGLIAAELLAAGDATGLVVLCSPQLAPQWQAELRAKFGIYAELLLPSTVNRLQRQVPSGRTSIYEHFPYLIISTDFIKQRTRRDEFALHCPDLVIVDEAHTAVAGEGSGKSQAHLRYALLRKLADDPERHLMLLTATPHSGDDAAWSNMIGLLDDRLGQLPADLSGPEREADRRLLAKFLIQRRRIDIRDFLDEETDFPERMASEEQYKLTANYQRLLTRVMAYARETVRDESLSAVTRRVRWWSVIALLRSLVSSPAAAASTLRNRSKISDVDSIEQADALAEASVFDSDAADAVEGEDGMIGADTTVDSDGVNDATRNRRRLLAFAVEADALFGPEQDAKLKRIIAILKKLVADGYHPILFCRYIPTAEYVARYVARSIKSARVEYVTGQLPPEEREARVADLMAHDGPRVLIATDCLSEGVNLQAGFTAVVHYDLAWNPTRHEQREGRVDRFGQTAPEVRTVTYYGADNGIDRIVMDVLIRRHEKIKKSTGVSVPIPVNSATVMSALWEELLLESKDTGQGMLDLGTGLTESALSDEVLSKWESAAEKEKASRSRFRQVALDQRVVENALTDARAALGGPTDVDTFVRSTLTVLGASLTPTSDGFTVDVSSIPTLVRDQLPVAKTNRLEVRRSLPAPAGAVLLARTDPTVDALARYTLDAALDPLLDVAVRPARRTGVMRTSAVTRQTALLVVRFRIQLLLPGKKRPTEQIAEDAQFLVHTIDDNGQPIWDTSTDRLTRLLDATPTGNVNDDLARTQLDRELTRIPAMTERFDIVGEELAHAARTAHRKVRSETSGTVRGLTATLLPPPDVLGVYLYLPDGTI